jgi:hypothetical protein
MPVNAEVGRILLPLPVQYPVPLLPFILQQSLEIRITSSSHRGIYTSTMTNRMAADCRGGRSKNQAVGGSIPSEGRSSYSPARGVEITLHAATAMDLDSTPRQRRGRQWNWHRGGRHFGWLAGGALRPAGWLAGGPTRTAGRRIRQQLEGGWPRHAPGRSRVRATVAWTRGG